MSTKTYHQIFKPDDISVLLDVDAEIVNMFYGISEYRGNAAFNNSINSFRALLVSQSQKGEFINGFDLDYRCYVVGLMQRIDDAYKSSAMYELLRQQ